MILVYCIIQRSRLYSVADSCVYIYTYICLHRCAFAVHGLAGLLAFICELAVFAFVGLLARSINPCAHNCVGAILLHWSLFVVLCVCVLFVSAGLFSCHCRFHVSADRLLVCCFA